MSQNLKTLISKLNDTTRRAAERAASLCMGRGHYEVDLEHFLLALLEEPVSDLSLLCRRYDVSTTELQRDLERELSNFKTGNTRTPVFSSHLPVLLEHGWLIASLESPPARIRSGHLLLALLTEPSLSQMAYRASKLFARFQLDELKHKLDALTAGSPEHVKAAGASADSAEEGAAAENLSQAAAGKTPALDQFTTNLTQRARDGKVDPVIGRDAEIRQAIDILMRRRQNNPILTGEAGVGKTAVVEGLALRIALNDVPQALQGVAVHVLDMGLLQAGASVKGEFENRLKNVIDEVKRSPHPIILFIDEAHTMIGAGGQAGQNDAANLLKPALARGELRTIAATTWGEYKKYFEKDPALARRFQVIKVEEPSEELACAMLRGMAPLMEKHFGVRLFDEAISEAVRLSARYISGRQLPDKAISVLDTACAKVALGQSATPARIEDARKRLDRLTAEEQVLRRELSTGAKHGARLDELAQERQTIEASLKADEERWAFEQQLVADIRALREQIETAGVASDADRELLAGKQAELSALQGERPLVPLQVDGHVVAEIVASWTGIPLGKMVKDEIKTVRNLQDSLQQRVIGQDHALAAIAQRVRTARAGLEDPNKPKGVFLFVGPSGVGKTETALALADILYGGERNLITINMSEYQEAHSVSGLKGSPPGYVGYGEGGVLTEAVRRKPYSVVLLDEVEKAHPDVLEMFFQVFDKGLMDDAEGREIDFRNTVIILTSNAGSQGIMQACFKHDEEAGGTVMKAFEELPTADQLADMLRPTLYKTFKPAFIGRTKVVPYYPLSDDVLIDVIKLKLDRIAQRVQANHQAALEYDDALLELVLSRCTEVDTGARAVDHVLNGSLLPEVADAVLARMAEGKALSKIKVGASKTGQFKFKIS
ncbi:type VI secretion system ATPase TssH [Aquabacterium sp.]|uniref:type VI secretion system ATPase TssH n=1 Tax=Aquabacterium sp. TaxID=1872578 RepID=UPI002E329978|nr:type VI secretion system ATPase TssH [Aquabacterium sp.]HEX5310453.1 type VI secretion system ATPase TssH [Aquabacterium sp.]